MTQDEVLNVFKRSGALLEGHFRLTSGLHSDRYLQSALVLQHPKQAAALGAALAARMKELGQLPDFVIAPALGGILVAHEVAREIGVRGLFAERQDGILKLRRGFRIEPGEKAYVVEDVVTTGGSTKETMDVVTQAGGVSHSRRLAYRSNRRKSRSGSAQNSARGSGYTRFLSR